MTSPPTMLAPSSTRSGRWAVVGTAMRASAWGIWPVSGAGHYNEAQLFSNER